MSQPLDPALRRRLTDDDLSAVEETLRSGWLTMGPRTAEFEELFAEHLGVEARARDGQLHRSAAPRLPGGRRGPRRRGDRSGDHLRGQRGRGALLRRDSGAGGRARTARPVGLDPTDVERRVTERTKAICAVHYGGYLGPVAELERLCAERGLVLIEDAAHNPSASTRRPQARHSASRLLQLLLQQGSRVWRGRAARDG